MTANEYYNKLNQETTKILRSSLEDTKIQSSCTDLKSNLRDWYSIISKGNDSSIMLLNAIEELDISCLQLLQGLYRSSFASLRLSLEMICGSIYYSAHNIEYQEWSNGAKDLIWAHLLCTENGIFSKRFANAYFPELNNSVLSQLEITKKLYRELSEMVHGNNKTWSYDNPQLSFNKQSRDNYQSYIKILSTISNYGFCLRYLHLLNQNDIPKIEIHVLDHLQHVDEIRHKIGGPINE